MAENYFLAGSRKILTANEDQSEMQLERDQKHDAKTKALLREQEPIIAELRTVGITDADIGQLMMRAVPYSQALPVILKHMLMPYSERIRGTLARCLAVTDAKYLWPILLEEYKIAIDTGPLGYKDGLAVALAALASDENFVDVENIMREPANGESRVYLIRFLKKSKNQSARELLSQLENDDELRAEIISGRRKMRFR